MKPSSGAVRTACGIQVNGRRRPWKPKIMWKKLTENDCSEWNLMTVNLYEKNIRRSVVRSAIQ